MISHIQATSVVVTDQEKALDFYVSKLGWAKAMDNQMGPDMRWLTVVAPGATTQLVLAHTSWAGEGNTPGGYSGVVLASPDIDATYDALTKRDVRFKSPVETMPWGQKATWFYDVDDNEFFLVEE